MSKRSRKQTLATRDGGARCRYCGARKKIYRLTIDHVVPRSRGGVDALTNCVLACNQCNHDKADKLPDEFMAVARV